MVVVVMGILIVRGASPERRPSLAFDGARAFAHVEKLVAMGPRAPGTPGHAKAVEYLEQQLRGMGLQPQLQRYVARTPMGPLDEVNVLATVPAIGARPEAGDSGRGFLIVAAHYDTKIFEDFEFVGANDGGSGTGALLELGRALLQAPQRPMPVMLAFLDGEEAVKDWSARDSLYGSRHLASELEKAGAIRNVKAFILMDMVGDRDLKILQDAYSTPWLLDLIWEQGHALGYQKHFGDWMGGIEDDHIPFLGKNVPSAVLIDLQFGDRNSYWHTPNDTLDKVSADSLSVTGRTVEATVLELMKRLSRPVGIRPTP